MLSSRITVAVPDTGVIVRRTGDRRYVYKVLNTFRNDRGQPTNTRVSIGRVEETTGRLVPNDAYWRHYPSQAGTVVELPYPDAVRCAGTGFIANQFFTGLGLDKMLIAAFGNERAGLLMTIATYMLARGNVMDHLDSFCYDQVLRGPPANGQTASALFASISHTERMGFFRSWAAAQPVGSYYAYDVTSVSSYADNIRDTEWGYNRDGEKLPQINIGCYVNQDGGLPVFYLSYPGSIVDVSHLPHMMAFNTDLGITDVGFVMDEGFCSTTNIQYMNTNNLRVIVKAAIRTKTVRAAIDQVRPTITSLRHMLPQQVHAQTVTGRFFGASCTLHVYHDPALAHRQHLDLTRLVDTWDQTLTQLNKITEQDARRYRAYFTINHHDDNTFTHHRDWDKIDTAARNNGYFTLLTTTSLPSSEVLDIYRRKDTIEKTFDDLKNHLDMARLRTHNTGTTDGKLFTAFIALILTSHLQHSLGPLMREKSWSKTTILTELDKIRVVTTADGTRLINPLTKTQRTILNTLGYTLDDIKTYIRSTQPVTYMPQSAGI